LPAAVRTAYLGAFTAALHPVFRSAAGVAALGFLLTWFLKEVPLRGSVRGDGIGESFAMPRDATSLEELERIVTRLARRENRWEVYRRIAERADLPLAPDEIWLLLRLCRAAEPVTLTGLSNNFSAQRQSLDEAASRLVALGMARRQDGGALTPTDAGAEAFRRLVAVRRRRLGELLAGWDPEEHAEVRAMLDGLAKILLAEPPALPEGAPREAPV
jgi:DNA-binding MarR family transcriptional regulator